MAAEEEARAPRRRQQQIPDDEEDVNVDVWQAEANESTPITQQLYIKWTDADRVFDSAKYKLRDASKCYDNTESEYYLKRANAAYERYFTSEKKLLDARQNFFNQIESVRKLKNKK